jgi:predicted methyltransferase
MRLMIGIAAVSGLVLGATLAQDAYMVPADTTANVKRAVESGARTDEQRARDSLRKPAEILMLAGIEEGDYVIEFAALGHYYTTMLVDAVGRNGHVEMVDMPWTDRFGGEPARAFAAEHNNATFTQVHYNEADLPDDVDVVTMVLFYHDLLRESAEESVDTADMNARVFAALKPGGTYLIVDHKAEDGSGWRDVGTLHRIDAQSIIDEVTAVGFELAVNSDLLANPADDRTLGMRDPAIRGSTDRAVFVFRKPM